MDKVVFICTRDIDIEKRDIMHGKPWLTLKLEQRQGEKASRLLCFWLRMPSVTGVFLFCGLSHIYVYKPGTLNNHFLMNVWWNNRFFM